MDIAGKVFIVTGGASGLGEGTARMLAAKGGKVVIADMQAEKGEAIAKDIGGAFVKCDVSNEADGQAVVAKAVSLGKLMGLVNCAGIAPGEKTVGKNGAHALATFTKCITVNLVGSFNMIRLASEAMSKNDPESTGERGVIISTAFRPAQAAIIPALAGGGRWALAREKLLYEQVLDQLQVHLEPLSGLARALAGLVALGFEGANVTMPHKTAVADHIGAIGDRARGMQERLHGVGHDDGRHERSQRPAAHGPLPSNAGRSSRVGRRELPTALGRQD